MKLERDARIDFFRGLALLFIFVDHIADNFLEPFTFQNLGFADAADVFVGLAGYAAFLAYTREFDRRGWIAGLAKVGRRIRGLYLAHILVLVVCVSGLILADRRLGSPVFDELVDLTPFLEDPANAFRWALTLINQPAYLDILPLYIILLAWFPILLVLLRLHVALALAVSAALWMGANALGWNLPSYPENEGWVFNPFAWQLLFTLGAVAAYLVGKGVSLPLRGWPLWGAIGFAICAFLIAAPWTGLPGLEDARLIEREHLVGADAKQNLSLWRVAHIAALAYIVAAVVSARAAWLDRVWARRVIDCGRNSLPVFCLGIVLSLAASVIVAELDGGWIPQIGVNALGILLLGLTGWMLATIKRASQSAEARLASSP